MSKEKVNVTISVSILLPGIFSALSRKNIMRCKRTTNISKATPVLGLC